MSTEAEPGAAAAKRRWRIPLQLVAFVGVLVAGVLIGWVVFHDDDGTRATTPAGGGPVVDPRVYPQLGLAIGVPQQWRTRFRQGVLNVASPDDSVSVAFSVAGGATIGPRVRRADRAQLKRLFKARELGRRRAKVGGASTILTELAGRTPKGQRIHVLSMGPSSRWRTYSIQVFTVPRPPSNRLPELRALLASIAFRQPR